MSDEKALSSAQKSSIFKEYPSKIGENGDRVLYYMSELSKCLEDPSPTELLPLFIYCIMLDSDFRPLIDDPESLPKSWTEKSPKFYKCSFTLLEYFCQCELVLTIIGDATMVVNLLCLESKNVYHLALDIDQWLDDFEKTSNSKKKLFKMKSVIRNSIVSPGKADLLSYAGLTGCNVNALPFEILHKIFLLLGPIDTIKLSSTCRRLRHAAFDNKLWEKFFLRDFGKECEVITDLENIDWCEKYQKYYKKKHNIKNPYVHRRRVVSEEMVYIPYRPALFRLNIGSGGGRPSRLRIDLQD